MLPLPYDATGPYRVALVCLGNICRSPMAAVVLADRVAAAGLADRVAVSSAGTGDWHIGQGMDSRALAALAHAGYDGAAHRAAQVRAADLPAYDLVLAMDAANRADLVALGAGERLASYRDFDPVGPGDVPDPYYDGSFTDVLALVERTSDALVAALAERLERVP